MTTPSLGSAPGASGRTSQRSLVRSRTHSSIWRSSAGSVSRVSTSSSMELQVEIRDSDPALLQQIEACVRDLTKLRCDVQPLAPGELPNDGVVIEDARSYR